MIKPFTLQEIGLKYGTDKAVTHFYMDNYEKYFHSWRDKEFTLLELGVGGGSSIATWHEYFPKANVYGIDNNADCAANGIFIGSQEDREFLDIVINKIGQPDIIIDDASHYGPYTIETFKFLFSKVRSGGYYVVEDTATFYSTHYSGEFESNGRSKVFNFFTGLAYDADVAGRGMTGNVEYALSVENPNFDPVPVYSRILDSIHIHPSLWFFKKR